MQGTYRVLCNANIPSTLVGDQDVLNGKLDGYKVAFLPFPLSLSRSYAQKLKEYVQNGGILISEACPGAYNEMGVTQPEVPAWGLSEVFGAREDDAYYMPPQGRVDPVLELAPMGIRRKAETAEMILQGTGPFAGFAVPASTYVESLHTTSGETILHSAMGAAGAVNQYGSGKAYLIGTFWGQSAMRAEEGAAQFILAILKRGGITSPFGVQPFLVRELVAGSESALVVANPSAEEKTGAIPVGDSVRGAVDLLSGVRLGAEAGQVTVSVPAMDACCLLLR